MQAAVHLLAAQPFEASQWLEHARHLVMGLGEIRTPDLVACALHPMTPPQGVDEVIWFWRCQHAAAFLLAGIPTSAPSDGNIEALDAMLAVRQDWNASAALSALLAVAETNEELRGHVWGRCYEILYAGPNGGDFPTATAAYWGLLRLDPTDQSGAAEAACAWIDGG